MEIKRVVFSALILVFFYNLLFFHTSLGVGTGLFFLLLNLFFYLNKVKEGKNLTLGITSSVISTVFAVLVAGRANEVVIFINYLTAVFFALSAHYFYRESEVFNFQIPGFILLPITVFIKALSSFFGLFTTGEKIQSSVSKSTTTFILRGVLITVPIFLVLAVLLYNADPVFAKIWNDLLFNLGERLIVSIIIFITLFTLGITKFIQRVGVNNIINVQGERAYEFLVILISLVSLFGLFIAIQIRYLFSRLGELELHQLGITSLTYSEYVRKGFFELLIASFIASLVLIYILKLLHYLKDSRKHFVQLFSFLLTLEIGLLLLSAAQRLNLYADAHGLTRARIFGLIFLIWLASILVILAIRIFKEYKRGVIFVLSLITVVLALLSINFINIDGVIATRYKPTVNDEIDYFYITGISEDAKDGWREALLEQEALVERLRNDPDISDDDLRKLYWAKVTVSKIAFHKSFLENKYGSEEIFQKNYPENLRQSPEYIKFLEDRNWQSLNLSEFLAYQDILENKDLYNRTTSLLNDIEQIELRVSPEIKRNIRLDRSLNPPF